MKCNLCGAEVMEGTRCPVCYEMSPLAAPVVYANANTYSDAGGFPEDKTTPYMRPFTKFIVVLTLIASTLSMFYDLMYITIEVVANHGKNMTFLGIVYFPSSFLICVALIVLCLLVLRGKRKAAKILTILFIAGICISILGLFVSQIISLIIQIIWILIQIFFAYKLVKEPWESFTGYPLRVQGNLHHASDRRSITKCRMCGADIPEGTRCLVCNEENRPVESPSNITAFSAIPPSPTYKPAVILSIVTDIILLLCSVPYVYLLFTISDYSSSVVFWLIMSASCLVGAFDLTLCIGVLRKKMWAAKLLPATYLIVSIIYFLPFLLIGILRLSYYGKIRNARWDDFT